MSASAGVRRRETQMEANQFLDAFIAIDSEGAEAISLGDLKGHLQRHPLKDSLAKHWLDTFDLNGDGTITLEEFCQVLGIHVKTARAYRHLRSSPTSKGFPPLCLQKAAAQYAAEDVQLIKSSADEATQVLILLAVKEAEAAARSPVVSDSTLADEVKQRLDGQLGRSWHVIVVRGQYAASFSHQEGMSLFFKAGPRIFLVWKTPVL